VTSSYITLIDGRIILYFIATLRFVVNATFYKQSPDDSKTKYCIILVHC
jgi:hypothetical protein